MKKSGKYYTLQGVGAEVERLAKFVDELKISLRKDRQEVCKRLESVENVLEMVAVKDEELQEAKAKKKPYEPKPGDTVTFHKGGKLVAEVVAVANGQAWLYDEEEYHTVPVERLVRVPDDDSEEEDDVDELKAKKTPKFRTGDEVSFQDGNDSLEGTIIHIAACHAFVLDREEDMAYSAHLSKLRLVKRHETDGNEEEDEECDR